MPTAGPVCTPLDKRSPLLLIDLVVPGPGAAGLAFAAADALALAVRFQAQKHGSQYTPAVGWRTIGAEGQSIVRDPEVFGPYPGAPFEAYAFAGAASAIVVPPLNTCGVPMLRQQVQRLVGLQQRLRQLAESGGIVCTIGSGAWLAAHAGVLDGETVSVPWNTQAWFSQDYPAVTVLNQGTTCCSGQIVSVGAAALLHELLSTMLRRMHQFDLADIIEQVLMPDAQREAAVSDMDKLGMIHRTRDSILLKAADWVRSNLDADITVETIADAASVSRRTLFRHFEKELKCRPLDLVTLLRVKRAQVLLEITLKNVDEIAAECGYSNGRSLRRPFQKVTGESLSGYRERHSQRAKRSRWRLEEVASPEAISRR